MFFLYSAALMLGLLLKTTELYAADSDISQYELFKMNEDVDFPEINVIDDDLYASANYREFSLLKYNLKTKTQTKTSMLACRFYSKLIPYDAESILGISYSMKDPNSGELSLIAKNNLRRLALLTAPTIVTATTSGNSILMRTMKRPATDCHLVRLQFDQEDQTFKIIDTVNCLPCRVPRNVNILASLKDGSVISVEPESDEVIRRSPLNLQDYTVIQQPGDGAGECIIDEANKTLLVRNERSVKLYSLFNNKFMHSISFRRTSHFAYHNPTQTIAVTPAGENIVCDLHKALNDNIFFYDVRKLTGPITRGPSGTVIFESAGSTMGNISFSQSPDPKLYLALWNTMYEIDPSSSKR